jgi:hypothetical protein
VTVSRIGGLTDRRKASIDDSAEELPKRQGKLWSVPIHEVQEFASEA